MCFMDENDKVMTEYLTKNFVDHSNIGLAPQAVSELSLHHRERGLDVRPFVVMRQKLLAPIWEVMNHLAPGPAPVMFACVRFKSDERCSSEFRNHVDICSRRIPFIGGNFGDLKVLCRGINKCGEQWSVVGIPTVNFDCRNNVGFNAAHDMALHPIMLLLHNAILMVKPPDEMAGRKTRRVRSKVGLNRFEGQTAFGDKRLQYRCQFGVLKVIGNRVEMRNLKNISAPMCLAEIAHETSLRNGRIDLERGSEKRVGQRQTRTARLARGRNQTGAQISQEQLKLILLMGLRLIVRRPILRISLLRFSDRKTFSNRHGAVRVPLPLHYEGCGIDMLTPNPASLMVGAGASSNLSPNNDLVFGSVARLRRDEPNPILLMNLSGCCQFQTALFSKFHDYLASLKNILLSRCRVVKDYFHKSFQKLLDTVSVAGILLTSWLWSPLSSRVINACVASTNGSLVRARRGSQEFARNVNRHIGTSPEKTSAKAYNQKEFSGGCEDRTRKCPSDTAVFKTAPLPIRDNPPLNSFVGTNFGVTGRVPTLNFRLSW